MKMLKSRTEIEASQTVIEIQALLVKNGVRKLIMDYDTDGTAKGLTFVVDWNNQPTLFALPCRWQGVLEVLQRQRKLSKTKISPKKAQDVAWRVLKAWIEAQLAIIEAGIVSLPEVFLPYAVTKDGSTLYELASSKRDQLYLQ